MPNKVADPTKKFGAAGTVVWETWRNARNGAPDTAFPPTGADPGPWLGAATPVARQLQDFDNLPLQRLVRREQMRKPGGPAVEFDPVAADNQMNETRLNKDTYEFVRANQLFNIEGQEALLKSKAQTITFPLRAKEIKAQWREITAADKPRYHWVEVGTPGGQQKIFGLTALHITTKDLPNWFWTTFEHIDNRTPAAAGGRPGNEGWKLKSRDRFACPTPPHDCEQAPKGIGLEGTKWESYRLRGTQVDFVDSLGTVTLLANSQPEEGFQHTSSCITCHARASIGNRKGAGANRISVFLPNNDGAVGAPDPVWFADDGAGGRYVQLDFIWSLFRARRVAP